MLFNGETMMQRGEQKGRQRGRNRERKGTQPIVFKRLSLRVSPLNAICLRLCIKGKSNIVSIEKRFLFCSAFINSIKKRLFIH